MATLQYWRADNMWAAAGRPDGNLGMEEVTIQPGQKRVFVTDWRYEKQRNDGTNYYGSHGRKLKNPGLDGRHREADRLPHLGGIEQVGHHGEEQERNESWCLGRRSTSRRTSSRCPAPEPWAGPRQTSRGQPSVATRPRSTPNVTPSQDKLGEAACLATMRTSQSMRCATVRETTAPRTPAANHSVDV
jgi:hypothetical protein